MAPFFNVLFPFKSSFIRADFKNGCLKHITKCYSLASLVRQAKGAFIDRTILEE